MPGHSMVPTGYDPALVALSVAIAIFAAYTALDLASRFRNVAGGRRWPWVGGAALTLGIGIWSMHFVGMLAFDMGRSATYDPALTATSLAIAIVVTAAAFAWVSRRDASPRAILVGGPLMGLGIAGMHYTGMAAMRMPGDTVYGAGLVILSVVIAIVAATAALWLTFRPHEVWQRLAAGVVMGIAVAGMHYTGMAAATFVAADAAPVGASQLNMALWVAGATFVVLFIAMLTSSLDQQRIQSELRESEARFRAAIQAVRGVLWTNDAEGRMTGEQPAWAAITGQSFDDYQGFGWADAVHPDDAQPTIDEWNATVAGKRTFEFEHRVRLADGGFGHYAVRAVPVLDDAGAIREWVGVHTDITAQRAAEAELRESNEEMQRYAYIVSHDLRAPLVNVMGFASELTAVQEDVKQALEGQPAQQRIVEDFGEALGFIKASVIRMERLIAAILKLSREGRRTLKPETLDMVALMNGLADAQRHQFEAAGARIDVADDLPQIESDRTAVEQIFGNLIDNAVKYLDRARPGRIAVRARFIGGGMASFDVVDNGRGIDAKDHGRVFELFRRSGEQDRPGEGIGLAHVRSLARALGGRIGVASEFGRGSTFSVVLPCDPAARRGRIDVAVAAE